MGSGKEVPLSVQEAIIEATRSGTKMSVLSQQYNLAKSTISKIFKRYRTRGFVMRTYRSGRPRKTTPRVDSLILRASMGDSRATASDIRKQVTSSSGISISQSTVQRRLRAGGLFGRRPSKKPLVSAKNRKARLDFARKHLAWNRDDWKKVLFSDESKFCLFGSDGIMYIRRPVNKRCDPKYQIPLVKHRGGSVMLWGCFSLSGVGPLVRIQGNMNSAQCKDILENVMLPFANQNLPTRWIFQHDNDPKHTSRLVADFLQSKEINVMEWPSQSPDLNPIEHLWEELARRTSQVPVKNADEKFNLLSREWALIPQSKIEALIDSMPRRCRAVVDSLGYPTKY
uniref:Paired domain-containing protein n=1 Tax=Haemonchus contortus TaxID=6289 RepID=A0A7I4Z4K4_HAECO